MGCDHSRILTDFAVKAKSWLKIITNRATIVQRETVRLYHPVYKQNQDC